MNILVRSKMVTIDISESIEYHICGKYVAIKLKVEVVGTRNTKEKHHIFISDVDFKKALSEINKCKSDFVYKEVFMKYDVSDRVYITTARLRKLFTEEKADSADTRSNMKMFTDSFDISSTKHSIRVFSDVERNGGRNLMIMCDDSDILRTIV